MIGIVKLVGFEICLALLIFKSPINQTSGNIPRANTIYILVLECIATTHKF
jgi:hypothetical protein